MEMFTLHHESEPKEDRVENSQIIRLFFMFVAKISKYFFENYNLFIQDLLINDGHSQFSQIIYSFSQFVSFSKTTLYLTNLIFFCLISSCYLNFPIWYVTALNLQMQCHFRTCMQFWIIADTSMFEILLKFHYSLWNKNHHIQGFLVLYIPLCLMTIWMHLWIGWCNLNTSSFKIFYL